MTKAKKTLSVLLAVLMVLGTCLFSAFAVAPAENTYKATLTVKPDVPTATAGQTVTFTVALTTTYAASTASAIVKYDDAVFENPVVTPSEDLFGAFPATEGEKYVNLPTNQAGAFVVDKSNKEPAVLKDAKLFDVALTVKANAPAGKAIVSVVDDRKAENHEGSLYCGRYDAATNKVVTYGQDFVLNNAEVTIEGGAAPADAELVLTDPTNGAVIDRVSEIDPEYAGFIYGIEGLDDVTLQDYVTTAPGTGEVTIETNDMGEYSTGAVITLTPANGKPAENYLFVYFGDVTGDGIVDLGDSAAIESSEAGIAEILEGSVEFMSADLTGDAMVDLGDSAVIESSEAGIADLLTQQEYAEQLA